MSNRLVSLGDNYGVEFSSGKPPVDSVKPAVYTVRVNGESGSISLMLDRLTYSLPANLYGEHTSRRDDILSAASRDSDSLGVILTGKKGEGKSLLAEDICNNVIASGRPVIRINSHLRKDVLMIIHALIGPACFYFDEFETSYFDARAREEMLDFFSDTSLRDCIFVLTTNRLDKLPDSFVNRPGRFLFHINHIAPTEKVINEIVNGELSDENQRALVFEYAVTAELNTDSILKLCAVMRNMELGLTKEQLIVRMSRLNIAQPKLRNVTLTLGLRTEDYDTLKDLNINVVASSAGRDFTLEIFLDKVSAYKHTAPLKSWNLQERIDIGGVNYTVYLSADQESAESIADYLPVQGRIVEETRKGKNKDRRDSAQESREHDDE